MRVEREPEVCKREDDEPGREDGPGAAPIDTVACRKREGGRDQVVARVEQNRDGCRVRDAAARMQEPGGAEDQQRRRAVAELEQRYRRERAQDPGFAERGELEVDAPSHRIHVAPGLAGRYD